MTTNIKLSGLSIRYIHGRNVVMCVPRADDATNKVLGPEQELSVALELIKRGYTISNAQEVLECMVKQYGFGA